MEGLDGIHVVTYEHVLPPVLRWIPGYRGLVKVDNPSRLHTVFEALCAQSKAIVYVFDLSLESDFLHAARHVDAHRDWSFGVKRDPGYVIYLVDEDRDDSPTSMVEFLSYNASGPWKKILASR